MTAPQRDEELAKIIAKDGRFCVGNMSRHSNVCGVQEANNLWLSYYDPNEGQGLQNSTIGKMISREQTDQTLRDRGFIYKSLLEDNVFNGRKLNESKSRWIPDRETYQLYMPELEAIFKRDLTKQLKEARSGASGLGAYKGIVNYWFNTIAPNPEPEDTRIYQCDPLVRWLLDGGWKDTKVYVVGPLSNPNTGNFIVGFSISTDFGK